MKVSLTERRTLRVLTMSWILVVGTGISMLGAYHARPGDRGSVPTRWPERTTLDLSKSKPTLIMFLHPRCPCSRASVAELSRLECLRLKRIAPLVVMIAPSRIDGTGWREPALERSVTTIPGVEIRHDDGGVEATRFGMATSGHVLLYSTSGSLLFSGGITPSRGHEGENDGIDSLNALILHETTPRRKNSVFGCPLVRFDQSADGGGNQ